MSAGIVLRVAGEMDLETEESMPVARESLIDIHSPEALLTFHGTNDLSSIRAGDEPLFRTVLNVLGKIDNENTAKSLSNILYKVDLSVKIQIMNQE